MKLTTKNIDRIVQKSAMVGKYFDNIIELAEYINYNFDDIEVRVSQECDTAELKNLICIKQP